MNRRAFLAMLAAWLAPRPTTLSAAPLDTVTTLVPVRPGAIDPDQPYLILTEYIPLAEFRRRYVVLPPFGPPWRKP